MGRDALKLIRVVPAMGGGKTIGDYPYLKLFSYEEAVDFVKKQRDGAEYYISVK